MIQPSCLATCLRAVSMAGLLLGGVTLAAQEVTLDDLPRGAAPAALSFPHFPDRLHAFVFRNWEVVETERLAQVVGATPQQILALGTAMGLPPPPSLSKEFRARLYLTVIRRNWHLLPYDQLLQLLDLTPAELAEILREDDFLFVKLGKLKPECPPLRYVEPNLAARQRAGEIKSLLVTVLGDDLAKSGTPRFDFLREWQGTPVPSPDPPAEGPIAPPTNQGRFAVRFVYSYVALFGDPLLDVRLDPFPEGLLARLAAVGVNGVWLHVVLRDLAPGGDVFPEFGKQHEIRLANLRKLAQRAARYGIGIYLYQNEPRAMPTAFFRERPQLAGVAEGDFTTLCTSAPEVRRWMSDALAHVFREVPELAGVFTITASENLTNCASHGQSQACPRCRDRSAAEIIAEVNQVIAAGVHRSQPQARVIAWDWGWNRHGDAADHIALLPQNVALMSVSEWAVPIERGGVRSTIGEYSMSAVGPGPRATRHWGLAQARGLDTFAKVQLNNTWELAAVPYLPVLDLVAEHCRNLAAAGVDGLMLSWSLGGYPSLNLEVAQRFNLQPNAECEQVLEELARLHYGEVGATSARAAWREFSAAFREYPYDGSLVYNGPQLLGPSNLLYLEPTGYRATMTGFPYDDLTLWRGIYPVDVFMGQFTQVAEGWGRGVELLREAVAAAPADLRNAAEADLRVAEAAECHFRSVVQQARFVALRDKARESDLSAEQRAELIRELHNLAEAELDLAQRLFRLARQDARIGFEASNQYLYVPTDVAEKIVNCRWISERLTR